MNAIKISPLAKRCWLDFAIFNLAGIVLMLDGADLTVPIVLLLFGCWNYYDGQTRDSLRDKP